MHGFESTVSNVPAFLVKLWKLVEDPSTDDLISWSERGNSFIIKDQATFAKELLPQYFKHNNMASFIRQLNMYGFRKLVNFEKGGLKVENHDMEFCNPFFLKGKVMMLDCIKRKVSVQSNISTTKGASESSNTNPKDILTDLTSIREKQESMNNLLVGMKKENELLWRELSSLRKKHKTQEQIIQKVIQFLVSIVQSGKPNIGMKRQMVRMLQDNKSSSSKKGNMSRQLDVVRGKQQDFFITSVQDKLTSPTGPVIHEVMDVDHNDALDYSDYDEPSAMASNSKMSCLSTIADDSASSPAVESPGPLSLFTPLRSRTPVLFQAEEEEQVLGLPVDFISSDDIPVPDIASVVSISNNGDDANEADDQNNVVLLPDTPNSEVSAVEDASNVISIPEDQNALALTQDRSNAITVTDVSNVISIPEASNIVSLIKDESGGACFPQASPGNVSFPGTPSNTISIPEVPNSSNVELNFTSDIIPFSPSFASLFSPKSTGKDTVVASSSMNSDLNCSSGSLANANAKTQLETTPDESSANLCSNKKDPFLNSKPEDFASKSKDLQLAVSEIPSAAPTDSTITKNAISNHILSVDEGLDLLRDQLTSGSLNCDFSSLLGLFSTDDVANNAALASQLSSENGVLRDTDTNIIGNELVQFNPSLDLLFEDGLLDCLGPDAGEFARNVDMLSTEPYEKVVANIKKENEEESCCLGKSSLSTTPSPSKKARLTHAKGKRKAK